MLIHSCVYVCVQKSRNNSNKRHGIPLQRKMLKFVEIYYRRSLNEEIHFYR